MAQLEIVPVDNGARYQVLDDRGHLLTDVPTNAEATAFVSGFQTGVRAEAQRVRVHVEQLSRVTA